MKKKLSLLIVFMIASATLAFGQNTPVVDEVKSVARVGREKIRFSVPLLSPTQSAATFRGSLVNQNGDEYSADEIELAAGTKQIILELPHGGRIDVEELMWDRFQFELADGEVKSSGIIAMSSLIPDLFEVRMLTPDKFFAGQNFSMRFVSIHPLTKQPAAGVELDVEITYDDENDDEKILQRSRLWTDASGNATLVVKIPPKLPVPDDEDLEIKVTGKRNSLETLFFDSVERVESNLSMLYTLDKPLYQPGQKVRFRGMLMESHNGSDGMTVVAGRELEFVIKDENYIVLYKTKAVTSSFGIVSGEWTIPANAKLGQYRLDIQNDNDIEGAEKSFRVSRYELPNFVVTAEPDRKFYLPEQTTARVTVDAKYLFGQKVAGGNVRVVREANRNWNYEEQKWETEEQQADEGPTDANGKFTAKIDLAKDLAELAAKSSIYDDVTFTAYFTDATSNRKEQRRFDIRLAKTPIIVTVDRHPTSSSAHSMIPETIYVTTTVADGESCVCDVVVETDHGTSNGARKIVATTRTNSSGLARIDINLPKPVSGDEYELNLFVRATSASGETGSANEVINVDDSQALVLVDTDKAIYQPGEPVQVTVRSNRQSGPVYVHLLRSKSSVAMAQTELRDGVAKLTLPYQKEFGGELEVSAVLDFSDDDIESASRRIVYPQPRALEVKVEPRKPTLRPGEEAELKMSVFGRRRTSQESALGITVIDRAVEERASSDQSGAYDPIIRDAVYASALSWNELDGKITPEIELRAYQSLALSGLSLEADDSALGRDGSYKYRQLLDAQFAVVKQRLLKRYGESLAYPRNAAELTRTLLDEGIDFSGFRDPFGRPYRVEIESQGDKEILLIISDGADKKRSDDPASDDFTAFRQEFKYFAKTGKEIEKAVHEYNKSDGRFVRDAETLKKVLTAAGIDSNRLIDPWGTPIRFDFKVSGRYFEIIARSAGQDRVFSDQYYWNDAELSRLKQDYFVETQSVISLALSQFVRRTASFPDSKEQFLAILKDAGIDFDTLRDGRGKPYVISFETSKRFADRAEFYTVVDANSQPSEKLKLIPVTQQLSSFKVAVSKDESNENYDLEIASFAGVVSEQKPTDVKASPVLSVAVLKNGGGAVLGDVGDINNAVIVRASLKLIKQDNNAELTLQTDESGLFIFEGVPPGTYRLEVEAPGFKRTVVERINVIAGNYVRVALKLEVGSISEVVTVSSTNEGNLIFASNALISTRQIQQLPLNGRNPVSLIEINAGTAARTISGGVLISETESQTVIENFWRRRDPQQSNGGSRADAPPPPRVRKYFPESLLWIPELITDRNGGARITFPLGDNLTTWNVYAIASDKKGRVGVGKSEIRTFQPFFVDLDPPPFLTVGDRILLPAQVRNYTAEKRDVDVLATKADWFDLIGEERNRITVDANQTVNSILGFVARKPVVEGTQRLTVKSGRESDAVEKPVTVRHDGREIVRTETQIFDKSRTFELDFPTDAIPNSSSAELRIYPNVLANVVDSIEGLLRRPYGCGEQTISSTYPNLMILRLAKSGAFVPSPGLAAKAKKNLSFGLDRLLGYQSSSGGFSYWGGTEEADLALTFYAIRFLFDASAETEVDPQVIKTALAYLARQQKADGSFIQTWASPEYEQRSRLMMTSYAARTFAFAKKSGLTKDFPQFEDVLRKSLDYISRRNKEITDPYALALFGLAVLDSGDTQLAADVARRLAALAIPEGSTTYFALELNTPFNGWGTTGRIEATALALQLLRRTENNPELQQRALQFLIRNKDRFGVWYSTQTTINVLDSLVETFSKSGPQTIRVVADGRVLSEKTVDAAQFEALTIPLTDVTNIRKLSVEGGNTLMAQMVKTHFMPWGAAPVEARDVNQSRAIELDYKCDKLSAKVMETITCRVKAERVGFRGYGMLLAEIGIPPGANVTREVLDKVKIDHPEVSRYEILPDRIVFYMWAKAGGTSFNFTFKPRYPINAKTPASVLYDYYNPEAEAVIEPLRFNVTGE